MPTPTATDFRPGRRSHCGRPGRRGNRSRFRDGFAEGCSTSRDTASSSASRGFRCPAQPFKARPGRLSAHFSLGKFVFGVRFRRGPYDAGSRLWFVGIGYIRRVTTIVGVGPLRIVHGEGAYHFGMGSTP